MICLKSLNKLMYNTLELGLDLERGMFVVEINIFNGCRDFFPVCDRTKLDWQYAKVFDK